MPQQDLFLLLLSKQQQDPSQLNHKKSSWKRNDKYLLYKPLLPYLSDEKKWIEQI